MLFSVVIPFYHYAELRSRVAGINPGMGSANERQRYIVTLSLIAWTHT